MRRQSRLFVTAVVLATTLSCAACSTVPDPPAAVGDDYPSSCMPPEFTWPTDFLEALPSESSAVGGSVVGLRLEYIDAEWVWRIRSIDSKVDFFGERVNDPGFGRESIVDVRTMEALESREIQLTEAEQSAGNGAYAAAHASGEKWPSPLIIEMARVMDDGAAVWQITTCDTATNEQTVMTVD